MVVTTPFQREEQEQLFFQLCLQKRAKANQGPQT